MVDGGMEMRWRKGGGSGTEKGLTKLARVIGPEVLREGREESRYSSASSATPHLHPCLSPHQDIMVQHRITPPF